MAKSPAASAAVLSSGTTVTPSLASIGTPVRSSINRRPTSFSVLGTPWKERMFLSNTSARSIIKVTTVAAAIEAVPTERTPFGALVKSSIATPVGLPAISEVLRITARCWTISTIRCRFS
ncbi:hypothetical protein DIDNDMLP_00001 [Klebsiella phage KP13-7]|nr:hypothetical protein DIDNDMLP_00001 [Klebsiella phage KP13-7]